MIKNSIDRVCSGCYMYERHIEDPKTYIKCSIFKEGEVCPCSTCLVKMVCSNMCQLLSEYIAKLWLLRDGGYETRRL